MKQLPINMVHIIALCLMIPNLIYPGLTTLKFFDPSPIYSANNSFMPPTSPFSNLKKARIKDEQPNKRRYINLNISGYFQKAVRAFGYNGVTQYGTVAGSTPNAFELGDFRGTMNVMGLFLGANPNNGKVIYDPKYESTEYECYVTPCTIQEFYGKGKRECLQEIALGLIQARSISSPLPPNCFYATDCMDYTTPVTNPLVFKTCVNSTTGSSTTTPSCSPDFTSIFDADVLAEDTTYFGAFSLPITYQQAGLRFELNLNFWDYVGITIQSGLGSMKQTYVNSIPAPTTFSISGTGTSSTSCPTFTNGQTTQGPYSLSNIPNISVSGSTTTSCPNGNPIGTNLYGSLAQPLEAGTPPFIPDGTAQAIFDEYVSNNIAEILNSDCMGSDPVCAFDRQGFDDIRVIANLQKTYEPFWMRHEEDDDEGCWSDVLFTPYIWIGGSVPTGTKINYRNILSLPFGNNGHASVGGGGGFLFDFAESIEVGVAASATYFLPRNETRPFPTHDLQRILYPFDAHVRTQPGINWNFKALLNAYQFIKHVTFWFTYEFIDHQKDCFTILEKSKAQYFVPKVLTCKSDWKMQFFNAAVVFDIMPGIQFSFVWQQPISPRNAYYPVGLMGSLNFLF